MVKTAQRIALLFVRLTKHNYGDQIKGGDIARSYCNMGENVTA